jgi:hypothetical protein
MHVFVKGLMVAVAAGTAAVTLAACGSAPAVRPAADTQVDSSFVTTTIAPAPTLIPTTPTVPTTTSSPTTSTSPDNDLNDDHGGDRNRGGGSGRGHN